MLKTTRRSALLAGPAMLAGARRAQSQGGANEIVIGGSIPLTGVFAFAGVGLNDGLSDYVRFVNEQGGVAGRRVRYVFEDTAYRVDQSVAAFNRLTSANRINFYYGDSTGFAKAINPELRRRDDILMCGASFATEINDPQNYPQQFMAGPDYSEMAGVLLEFIQRTQPGARVALVHSDTEFGRDPIQPTEQMAGRLGLRIVEKIVTPPGSVDVSTEVLKLRRANPDYTIMHGYVLAPLPEFIQQARQMNLRTRFMGTFWSMDNAGWARIGQPADGMMGVNPYRYHYEEAADAPMVARIRRVKPEYQPLAYMKGWLTGMLFCEIARRTIEAGQPMSGTAMKAALNSIRDFDTGGIIGAPVSIQGNTIPVGRVYRFDAAQRRMVPEGGWIRMSRSGA
jgi:branched-chain amino acid transport system substrate-binding protein